MGGWKYIFELASKDLELLRRKKQALENLFSSNRISQQTYEYLGKEIGKALMDVERYMETIVSEMKGRLGELEKQIGILEIFLANTEILHAAGEINYETYESQSKALLLGLESMRNERNEIESALSLFASKSPQSIGCKEVAVTVEVEPIVSAEVSTGEKPEKQITEISS